MLYTVYFDGLLIKLHFSSKDQGLRYVMNERMKCIFILYNDIYLYSERL